MSDAVVVEVRRVPAEVWAAAAKAVKDHPGDCKEAARQMEAEVRDMKGFEGFLGSLVSYVCRDMVYVCRHQETKKTKRSAGLYGGGHKTNGASRDVELAYRSLYDSWHIGGTALGDVLGKDIDGLVAQEQVEMDGHQVNRDMLLWLKAKGVRDDKRVRDVVPEREAERHYRRLRKAAG